MRETGAPGAAAVSVIVALQSTILFSLMMNPSAPVLNRNATSQFVAVLHS